MSEGQPEPGRTLEPDELPREGALGLLAVGARGLDAWRRRRDAGAAALPPLAPGAARGGRKVLLIGWDAADRRMISPLVDAGLMPTLHDLICRGAIGNLRTLIPPVSPLIWTSIATGQTPDRHGILGFTEPGPAGELRPIRCTSRRVKALWNMAHQAGLRSCVVGWWPSHPVEPIDGAVVSNLFQQAPRPGADEWPVPPGSVHPPELAAELAALRVHPLELTAAHLLPFVPHASRIDQSRDVSLAAIAGILAETASVHAVATWLMERTAWDLMAVYYDALDHFGHGFMRFHPPRREHVPEDLFDLYQGVMTAAYRFQDMLLERLLELAGPDCTVVLVSDHGFHPDHLRPKRVPRAPPGPLVEHREQGVICVAGPGVKPDELIFGASVLDVAPTVLALLGLPIGRDMGGKPLSHLFEALPEVGYVESWEQLPGDAGRHPAEPGGDPWVERAALERLADLGYVELPTGAATAAELLLHRSESRLNLARCLMSQRRDAEAWPILDELVAAAPGEPRYGLFRAECALRLGRPGECRRQIDDLRAVLQARAAADREAPAGFAGASAMLDVLEGGLCLALREAGQALRLFRRARDTGGLGAEALVGIGSVHLRRGEWSLALASFDQALRFDADCAAAHRGRAVALLRSGRPEAAAAAALEAVGLDYADPLSHFQLGAALTALKQFSRAAECFETCLRQAPALRAARTRLVALYERRLGRPEAAAPHRRRLDGWTARARDPLRSGW